MFTYYVVQSAMLSILIPPVQTVELEYLKLRIFCNYRYIDKSQDSKMIFIRQVCPILIYDFRRKTCLTIMNHTIDYMSNCTIKFFCIV